MLDVAVKVTNPNSADFKIRKVVAYATLEDKFDTKTFAIDPEVWVAAHSAATLHVPVRVPWQALSGIGTSASAKREVHCRVRGTVWFVASRTAQYADSRAFDERKTLDQKMLMDAAAKSFPVPVPLPPLFPLPLAPVLPKP